MSEHTQETDPLLEQQQGKGYGDDEGEREAALEQEEAEETSES